VSKKLNPICLFNGTVLDGFTMERCAVFVEDGVISDIFLMKRFEKRNFDDSVRLIDIGGDYIAPGFIDTHIHGTSGYGVEDAGVNPPSGMEAMLEMSKLLAQQGVTAFNPTLYPCETGLMIKTIKEIVSAMGKEEGARIKGLHLEGPFLSPERLGAQKKETIQPVNLQLLEQLWEASYGNIVNMTVAPELKNMRELALSCIKKGIVLQAGHTDAEYSHMVEGMQAGILHCTHFFNAMKRLDHRDPNAVGAILIHPEMSCEIIADNYHIHPELFRLLLWNKRIEKIVLVTDGLKPTQQKDGPLIANGEEVYFDGIVFRRKSDDVICGSNLTMINGIKNLVNNGFTLEEAVRTASRNPAQIMHYNKQGAIIPGHYADITVFNKDFEIKLVMVGGKIVKEP
jgi:N-acetylglucosamine-6-phosphate deacetylase